MTAIVLCFPSAYAADWYQSAKNADEKVINTDATYGTMTMDGWYEKFNAGNTPDEVMNFGDTRYKNYLTIRDATVTTGHLQQNAMGGRWNNCPGGSWWYYWWSAKFFVEDGAQFTANTAQIDGYYYQNGGVSNIGTLSLDWHNGKRVPSRSAGTLEVNGGMMTIGTLNIADNNVYTYVNGGALEVGTQGGNGTLYLRGGELSVDGWSANGRINMSGGTYNTPLESAAPTTWDIAQVNGLLFNGSDTQASLNASAIHKSANVGELKNDWVKHFTISGGTINFSGTYTQTQANRATSLIKSKFGNNINVTFDQIVADSQAADVSQGLTMAISNSIIAENSNTRVNGTIFTQHKYDARTQDLLVGDVMGVMTNVGYTAFNGNKGATVKGGKTLALLGLGGTNQIATGTLDIQNGTLRLGTNNTSVTVGGNVSTVALGSSGLLNTLRGTYNIDSVTGAGIINADSGALNIQTLDLSGQLNNKAIMTVANAANVGRGTNSGTLSMSDLNLTGSFTNTGTANINGALTFSQNGRYTQTAGTLRTLYDNVFTEIIDQPDDLNTVSINATVPEEIKTTLTEFFTLYVPGQVAENLAKNASFTGGKVIVNGDGLTITQRDDLIKAFKQTFDASNVALFNHLNAPFCKLNAILPYFISA